MKSVFNYKSLAKDHIVSQSNLLLLVTSIFCNQDGEGGNNNTEASKWDLRN